MSGTPPTRTFGFRTVSEVFQLATLIAAVCAQAQQPPKPVRFESTSASPDSVIAEDVAITRLLEPIRREHDVPALIAAVVTGEGLQRVGVVGVRKRGLPVPATTGDLWHLGSNTKAMTATLIGRLVERGQLTWDSRLPVLFPHEASRIHEDWAGVTLRQLLSHRSGLRSNLDLHRYRGDDVQAERRRAVREYLAEPPDYVPGTRQGYSNLGYILAGAAVEEVTGEAWERVMAREVFVPLGMPSAGFGGLGTPGTVDQPWPHDEKGVPLIVNGPAVDNPPVMGPAGRVHCTIQDWARFIADQLRGAGGERALLQPQSYAVLHTTVGDGEYALGWVVVQRDWGRGTVLHHTGDNTMNHANVWIAPRRGFALLACCNQGGRAAALATDQAIAALINTLEDQPDID